MFCVLVNSSRDEDKRELQQQEMKGSFYIIYAFLFNGYKKLSLSQTPYLCDRLVFYDLICTAKKCGSE